MIMLMGRSPVISAWTQRGLPVAVGVVPLDHDVQPGDGGQGGPGAVGDVGRREARSIAEGHPKSRWPARARPTPASSCGAGSERARAAARLPPTDGAAPADVRLRAPGPALAVARGPSSGGDHRACESAARHLPGSCAAIAAGTRHGCSLPIGVSHACPLRQGVSLAVWTSRRDRHRVDDAR